MERLGHSRKFRNICQPSAALPSMTHHGRSQGIPNSLATVFAQEEVNGTSSTHWESRDSHTQGCPSLVKLEAAVCMHVCAC